MNRREFLKTSMAGAAFVSLGKYGLSSPSVLLAETSQQAFNKKLFIPPILDKTTGEDGVAAFRFAAQSSEFQFLEGRPTATLGYNGPFLGPTLRVRDKEIIKLRVHNQIDQVTTVHWHGLHVPAEWDGGPRQTIAPGEIWAPQFQVKQQAATLWYHPHALGKTGEHVYKGLAGLFIIDDEISEMLPLPSDYGVDDIPLILQDRRFYEDGSFAYVRSMHDVMHGVLGNILLVNGMIKPSVEVTKNISRFRVLNGSNSSIYRLRFSNNEVMHVIGSDGGFLSKPVPVKELVLSAGERAEILMNFSGRQPGDKLRLIVDQFGGNSFEALECSISNRKSQQSSIPGALREQAQIKESEADNRRYFAMETMSGSGRGMGMMGGGMLTINGRKMDTNRVDERIQLGSTEIWELENRSASMMQLPHSMHLHDVQFNILDRNGMPPAPVEAGRKDTVLLWPNDRVRIIARFLDYKGVYMYHCHMLEHEDDGMMGQFEVFDDGLET